MKPAAPVIKTVIGLLTDRIHSNQTQKDLHGGMMRKGPNHHVPPVTLAQIQVCFSIRLLHDSPVGGAPIGSWDMGRTYLRSCNGFKI